MKLSASRALMRAKRDRLFRTIRVMKFTAFLIFSVSLHANAELPGTKKNLSPDNVPSPFAYIEITGSVKDEQGEPVVGASIAVKGNTSGTSTDASGNFRLQVSDQQVVLVVSSVGFETREVSVSKSGPVSIVLVRKGDTNEEVVVIGYGTQKKVDVTGAISTVSADKVNQGINQSVSHALQGRAPGLTVIQNSGEPGAGVEIRIRGAGSINDNSPLYVVDGIISGGISYLNPADIESISVLKDAASASIYGSRGANGVIIVTTKKGKRDQKTAVSFNTSQGIQKAWRMPTALSAEQRNTIHKEALTNDGTPTSDPIWDYYNNPDNAVTRTDWFDEVLQSAYMSNYDLAIRGGSSRSNYSFSLGYLNNDGIVKNSNFKRYNVRFNSQHDIAKNLTFGENISIMMSEQKAADIRSSYTGVLSSALFNMRNIPVWEDEAAG
ncbi:MAG TPA: SusC/RagA family TonB-linked outer membrane protein, partial [Flavitalea sp.]|nr:SusC/RagA family TonB-linked outer membrane protein [Flavitalea sp.]